jgi:hypothetical protein
MPRLLVMIEDFGKPWDPNDKFRFAKVKIRDAAWAALDHGMRTAAEILEAGDAMQRAVADTGEKQ